MSKVNVTITATSLEEAHKYAKSIENFAKNFSFSDYGKLTKLLKSNLSVQYIENMLKNKPKSAGFTLRFEQVIDLDKPNEKATQELVKALESFGNRFNLQRQALSELMNKAETVDSMKKLLSNPFITNF